MNLDISKKAAKRKQRRLREKQKKALEKLQKENQDSQSESKQQEELVMEKIPEKSKEQILAERQVKKAAKQTKSKDTVPGEPVAAKSSKPTSSVKSNQATAVKVQAATAAKVNPTQPPTKPSTSSTKPNSTQHSAKIETSQASPQVAVNSQETPKSKEQVHAEREARRLAKQSAKKTESGGAVTMQPSATTSESICATTFAIKPVPKLTSDATLASSMSKLQLDDNTNDTDKAKTATKAERRAIQEAQRAAKAKALEEKNKKLVAKKPSDMRVDKPRESMHVPPKVAVTKSGSATAPSAKPSALHKVKLFKHLYTEKCDTNINVNHHLHPAILKLGLQYSSDSIVGSNARCYAFLNAMKTLIADYVTPAEKIFSRGLEAEIQPAIEFLQSCRPLAVSMTNALKYIKVLISLDEFIESDDDKKQRLIDKIDTYASEQIETAAIAISLKVREKISNGDVILTYGCSSLIKRTLVEAFRDSEIKFRVIVVDSRPDHEGQEMLKSLAMLGINCTYVLINSISFIMPEVTKVLLGAHALLANGYVMSRVGTAQIALVANSYNVPVLVCCETHKFSERVQTDAFVFNELGDPGALIMNKNSRECSDHLKDWESIPHLTPLNLRYDVTPPELVTAVVTEVAILPCTSVQVILRVKPAE